MIFRTRKHGGGLGQKGRFPMIGLWNVWII